MQQTSRKWKMVSAIAALGGLMSSMAIAQSNVSINGTLDTFAGSLRNSGDTSSKAVVNSGGMTTSWIGFRGTEDLGNGLKANFTLNGFLRLDTGESGRFPGNETLFSRDANVGIGGNFGTITLGRSSAPNLVPTFVSNAFGDSFAFSPLVLHLNVPLFNASGWSSSHAGDTGWSNQIKYTTPSIRGLSANLQYQFGETAGDNGKNNIGGNLLYFQGPLTLTGYYQKVEVNNPLDTPAGTVKTISGVRAAQQKIWFVGGAYDFKMAKLFASYDRTSHNVDLEDRTVSTGVSVPAGSGKILAEWAQTKRSGTGFADRKRNTASIGYDYDLSKRTDLYAVYMRDRITGFDSGNSFGAGIRHRF